LKTVRNAASGLLRDGVLADTGEKAGRSRILIPHSQSTKGTGTGMTEEAGDVGPLAPSTDGHKTAAATNGRKTVPTEVPELTVEQAATGHNGIIGEHGHQVESPRERRRRERREEIAINDPQLFYAMSEEDRRQLLAWVRDNLAPRRGKQVRDSYWLKHEAEHRLGFYVGNGELKGAMLEAGHRPVWDNRINMGFCAVPPSRAAPGVTNSGKKPKRGGKFGSHSRGQRRSCANCSSR
jgi:hypothetical protein